MPKKRRRSGTRSERLDRELNSLIRRLRRMQRSDSQHYDRNPVDLPAALQAAERMRLILKDKKQLSPTKLARLVVGVTYLAAAAKKIYSLLHCLPPGAPVHPGFVIKMLRTSEGLRQEELAEALGVTRPYLSQVEMGRKVASLAMLKEASEHFQIPLAAFFPPEEDATGVEAELRTVLSVLLQARLSAGVGRQGRGEEKKAKRSELEERRARVPQSRNHRGGTRKAPRRKG